MNLLLIAIGGALGSVARYLISSFALQTSGSFFLGTFIVNLIGSAAFGAIVGAAEQRFAVSPELRTFMLIGVLGGFTTFSSYAYESVVLLRSGQVAAAAVNILGQVVLGLAVLWATFAASR